MMTERLETYLLTYNNNNSNSNNKTWSDCELGNVWKILYFSFSLLYFSDFSVAF